MQSTKTVRFLLAVIDYINFVRFINVVANRPEIARSQSMWWWKEGGLDITFGTFVPRFLMDTITYSLIISASRQCKKHRTRQGNGTFK